MESLNVFFFEPSFVKLSLTFRDSLKLSISSFQVIFMILQITSNFPIFFYALANMQDACR